MVNDASSAMQGGLRFVAQPVAARVEIHREPFVAERFRIHPNVAPPPAVQLKFSFRSERHNLCSGCKYRTINIDAYKDVRHMQI